MNTLAIRSSQLCCQIFSTINLNLLVKKQLLLFLTFLFLGMSYSSAQLIPCANNNDDMPTFSVADAYNPNFSATLELETAIIGPGDDFCIGNDPGKDTIDGSGSFLFTGLEAGPDGCPIQFCFSPRQGCGNALGNTCIWVEDPNNPGQWMTLGALDTDNFSEVCVIAPPGVTEYAIVISRPGMGPVSVNDVMIVQAPELDLGEDQEACGDFLPVSIDLTSNEPAGQTGGTWSTGSGSSGTISKSYTGSSQNWNGDDTGAVASLTINEASIPSSAVITDVNVSFAIDHSWVADLEVNLIAPDGSTVLVLGDACGSEDNVNVTLDDESAGVAVDLGCNGFGTANTPEDCNQDYLNFGATLDGNFKPQNALTTLDGGLASGTWTLQIVDDANDDPGCIQEFSITVEWSDPVSTIPDPSNYQLNGNVGDMFEFTYSYDASSEAYDGCIITDTIKYTLTDDCCDNPINPAPDCNAFDVIVVLDESGSIGDEAAVENATLALANALIGTGANMAIVEFSTNSSIGSYGGYTNYNLVDQAYYDALAANLPASYSPDGWTNWEDALNDVLTLNDIMVADIVLFMTDGNPTAYINDNNGNTITNADAAIALQNALDEACEVKNDGSHIFMLGVDDGITDSNLIAISGNIQDDGPGNPALTPLTADYGLISSGDLTPCFLDIAQNSCTPNLTFEKTVYAGHDDTPGESCSGLESVETPANGEVTYCFTLTNNGEQALTNLTFDDTDLSTLLGVTIDETDLTPAWNSTLDPGESASYYLEVTLPGSTTYPFENCADVTADTPGGQISVNDCAEVTEPSCVPEATCNILDDVNIESCDTTIPSEYDAGNAEAEIVDIFTNVVTCGNAGIRHEDSAVAGDQCSNDGATITRTYYLTDDGVDVPGAECTRDFVFNAPDLSIDCPADVNLPSCSTEQEIADAYAIWAAGFVVNGGCNSDSNIAQIPALPAFACGEAVNLSFELSATDDCNPTPLTCSASFNVTASTPLSIDCPTDVNLPSCSTEQEIADAYAIWAAGFVVSDGCNSNSNIAQVPALPAYVCGGGVNLSFELSATDDCNSAPLTCSASFNVAASTPLSIDCPTDVNLPSCSTEQEIADAYAIWAAGFAVNDGCNANSNIAQIPALPAYVCGAGVNLSFELSATDDCNPTPLTCSASFTVGESTPLGIDCPTDVNLPSCSTEQEIADAYAIWASGFVVNGGCNSDSNIAQIPALPAFGCGEAVSLSFELSATDDCNSVPLTCSASFNVAASTPLSIDCPTDVNLPSCSTAQEIADAYAIWAAGFVVSDGCNADSNIAQVPALPAYVCGAGINLSFELSATDDCNSAPLTCSASFTVTAADELEISDVQDLEVNACDFEDQAALDAAFASWLSGFGFTGGCDVQDSGLDGLSAPDLCAEGDGGGPPPTFDDSAFGLGDIAFSAYSADNAGASTEDAFTIVLLRSVASGVEIGFTENGWFAAGGFRATESSMVLTFGSNYPAGTQIVISRLPFEAVDQDGNSAGTVTGSGLSLATGGDVIFAYDPANIPSSLANVSGFVAAIQMNGAWDADATSATTSAQPSVFTDGVNSISIAPEVDNARVSAANCNNYSDIATLRTMLNTASNWETNNGLGGTGSINPYEQRPPLCNFVEDDSNGGTIEVVVTYTATGACDSGEDTATFTLIPAPELTVSCPDAVSLDASATEQEIMDAYDAWVAGFIVEGGCNPTTNIGDIPALPDFMCGTAIDLSFTLMASDNCNVDGVECSSTFMVDGAVGLTVSCPTDVNLPSCSTEQEIADAYAIWAAGFTVNNGTNPTSNIADLPALPDFACGGGISLNFTLTAFDNCAPNGVSCESLFNVAASTPLSVACPTDVNLPSCSTAQEISDAYALWVADFAVNDGCNANSNIAQIPLLPAYVCGAGINLSFELSATDDCNPTPLTCSASFNVAASTPLGIDCPTDVNLPSCSTEQEIADAYAIWAAGFVVNGGCNSDSNIAQLPSLPAFGCGEAVSLSFELSATDDCNSAPLTCSASFNVAASTPLSIDCPTDVNLPSCSTEQEIADAYAIWAAGFVVSDGCNTNSNIAQVPALPAYVCGGGVNLSFELSATDDCNSAPLTCSASFTVTAADELDISDVQDLEVNACDFEDQAALDAAFASWLSGFGYTGGCDVQDSGLDGLSAPDLCAEGDGGGGPPPTFDDSAFGLGDLAFSAYNSDTTRPVGTGDDSFTIVLLRSVASGVEIGFTENGWFAAGGFRDTESSMTLTFGSNYPAGTQIIISRDPFEAKDQDGNSAGTVNGSGLSLSTGGDVIFAYDPANIPSSLANVSGFVAAIQMNGSWDGDSTSATTSAQPSVFTDGVNSISIAPEVDNARFAQANCGNYSDIASLRTLLNTASNWETNDAEGYAQPTPVCNFVEDDSNGGTIEVVVTYTATGACDSGEDTATFTLIPAPELTVSCPDAVALDASATEQEIQDAYDAWVAGFIVDGGCNPTTNIGDIPALPAFECGSGINLSFTLMASDNCNVDGVECSSTFMVEGSTPLSIDCPTAVILDSCATEQEIQDAYDAWVAGFVIANGINPTSNIADLPALPDYVCGGLVDLSFEFQVSDACSELSCSSTFFVKEASPLSTNCPTDPGLDACANEDEIQAAYDAWVAGFSVSGGCADATSNIEQVPALPDYECGAGISLSFTLEATDACNTSSCSSTFTVNAVDALTLSCPQPVQINAPTTAQEIQDAYDAWVAGFTFVGGCDVTSNIGDMVALPEYVCGEAIDLYFEYVVYDTCNPNGITCSSQFYVEPTEPVDAGLDGEIVICEDATVTAQQLFDALGGDPDDNGTWSPDPAGAGTYVYTVMGDDPCPDDTAEVVVTEQIIVITPSDPVCDEALDFGTYSVDVTTNGGNLTSDLGDVTDNGGNSWTIDNIPNDNNVTVTVTTDLDCEASIEIEAPDCICIELDWEYTNVTCNGEDDGTITVNFVTEGAVVTINGLPYDPEMLYPPGDYIIEAYFEGSNDPDCYISDTFEILEPDPVDFQVTSTPESCYGAGDGTITVFDLSENATYIIQRNGVGPDLSDQDFFEGGFYIVTATVSDDFINNRAFNPCVKTRSILVGSPKPIDCEIVLGFEKYPDCDAPDLNYLTLDASQNPTDVTVEWSLSPESVLNGWEYSTDVTNETVYFTPGNGIVTFIATVEDEMGCIKVCQYTTKQYCNGPKKGTATTINVYPNPVRDILNVDFGKTLDSDTQLVVTDLVGNIVYSRTISKNEKVEKTTIDFSRFLSNVYYLKITDKYGSTVKKVILDK